MNKVTFLAAAAAVAALAASPALAQTATTPQDSSQSPAAVQAKTPQAGTPKAAKPKAMRSSSRAHHRAMKHQSRAYRNDDVTMRDDWNGRGTGFWPADVVGGAVGAAGAIATTAVGTAGAIATAPFGGPRYDRSYYYSDASGYPYGNRHRYGASYASMGYDGLSEPGYVGAYSYDGVAIPASPSYDARNGFTCRPGTITRIGNQSVICQ